jgi:predicted nuclease of predicted toxin-antitoxin system
VRQIDVLTAYEDDMHDAEDEELLNRASQLQRVLFSQDDDLLLLHLSLQYLSFLAEE